MPHQVGFIGLGRMGVHMATHIHRKAPVGVWNRGIEKAAQHSEKHKSELKIGRAHV